MRIGELAKRSGVSRDTIRYYERCGLIRSAPSRSSTNSYRSYGEDAELTLEMINEAQAAGLTLDDVREFVSAVSVDANDNVDVMQFLDNKISEVEIRLAQCQRFLTTLQDTKAAFLRGPDNSEFDWPSEKPNTAQR